jgi:hypothetical protein
MFPDKATLYLSAIEDSEYKEDKINCELSLSLSVCVCMYVCVCVGSCSFVSLSDDLAMARLVCVSRFSRFANFFPRVGRRVRL